MLVILAAAAAIFAQAEPGAATASAASAPTERSKDKQKLVCKREPQLGTRFAKRVCRTPEQIAEERLVSRNATEDIQRTTPPFGRGN